MKFALQSPKEIVTSYRQSADRAAQIGILAELNLCEKSDIVTLLEAAGEDMEWYRSRKQRQSEKRPHVRWTREECDLLREKLQQGYSIEEVAEILGRTESSAYHQAYNYGFLPNAAGEAYRKKKREEKKKGKPDAAGQAPKENNLVNSISQPEEKSKSKILQDMVSNGEAKVHEMADTVRKGFPGMTRDLMRKCMLPEEYGVELTDPAIALLGKTPKKRKADKHRLRNRVMFRVNDAEYAKLQARLSKTGDTMQSFMYRMFLDFFEEVQNETSKV